MTNNDILRRLRYTFNFNDNKMIALFGLAELKVTREQISAWLKKEDDPAYINLTDSQFAVFLNGLINDKRGKKEGPQPAPEKRITNNIILTKLKIALNLKAEDIVDILALADFNIGKSELSAFFRKSDHKHFRQCKDQFLRNFIQGLDQKFHVARPERFKSESNNSGSSELVQQPSNNTAPSKSHSNKYNQSYANKSSTSGEGKKEGLPKNYNGAKPKASKIYVNPKAKSADADKPQRKTLKLKPKDIWGE